jgi:hypothetical protein
MTPEQKIEMTMRAAERAHDQELSFSKSANDAAIKNAEEAIKASILINGGSSVAMLAFVGTLISRNVVPDEQFHKVFLPLIWFGSGLALAMITSAAAYFVNLLIAGASLTKERIYEHPYLLPTDRSRLQSRIAEVCRWSAILTMTGSIVCFICGLSSAKNAFEHLKPPNASQSKWG